MATLDHTPRATAGRAWDVIDQAIGAAVAGDEFRHPSGTVFVPEDVPDRDVALARYASEGKRVVVVRADGGEELVNLGRRRETWTVLVGLGLLFGWLAGRRSTH